MHAQSGWGGGRTRRAHGGYTHSSLERTQTGGFDIRRLVGEPEPRGHVHDEAERVPVLNLRHPHALDVSLGALLQLLLHMGRRKMNTSNLSAAFVWKKTRAGCGFALNSKHPTTTGA